MKYLFILLFIIAQQFTYAQSLTLKELAKIRHIEFDELEFTLNEKGFEYNTTIKGIDDTGYNFIHNDIYDIITESFILWLDNKKKKKGIMYKVQKETFYKIKKEGLELGMKYVERVDLPEGGYDTVYFYNQYLSKYSVVFTVFPNEYIIALHFF